jgi:hypothetical protein
MRTVGQDDATGPERDPCENSIARRFRTNAEGLADQQEDRDDAPGDDPTKGRQRGCGFG